MCYVFVCDWLCEETSDKERNNKYCIVHYFVGICYAMCTKTYTLSGLVALSVLSSPLDSMHNLSAKLMLLLHHINNCNRNKEAIVQFSCIIIS